jgi:hypothetical protein
MKTLVLGPFASFATFITHEVHHLIIICNFGSNEIKHMVKIERVKMKIEKVTSPYVKPLYGKLRRSFFIIKPPSFVNNLHLFMTCASLGRALNA